ncbi:MAG: hypothetical protein A2X95_09335 [Syntrophobacterales bacterium GWF2_56_9]|nr:MAG: hypothetical protein A2X95_09335 [Syntrophobacterales bacterium GWF2_56_9]
MGYSFHVKGKFLILSIVIPGEYRALDGGSQIIIFHELIINNEPPRSKLQVISWLVAPLESKQASGNMTRRDSKANTLHYLHNVLF